MKLNLFFNKKTNHYKWLGKAVCLSCNQNIDQIFFLHFYRETIRSPTVYEIYCVNCIQGKKHKHVLSQTIYGRRTGSIQKFDSPIFEMPFGVGGNAKLTSNFDAVHLESEHTENKTVHALRGESFENAQIGRDITEELEHKDSKDPVNMDSWMEDQRSSVPYIEESKREKLEDKSNETGNKGKTK